MKHNLILSKLFFLSKDFSVPQFSPKSVFEVSHVQLVNKVIISNYLTSYQYFGLSVMIF